MDHRLSIRPETPEERQGPPGLLGRPLRACRDATPRRIRPLLAPTSLREDPRRGRHRLQGKQNPRHPEQNSFRGRNPTAHTLAYLRFADPVAETVARLTTGPGGLTPGRAGFAPAGRQTKFHGEIASLHSPSTSLAWSHRNQQVSGSIPLVGSIVFSNLRDRALVVGQVRVSAV